MASYRIFCFGDSNTAGFYNGGQRFEPYADALGAALQQLGTQCIVTHSGLNGLTAQEMFAKAHDPVVTDSCGHVHKGLVLHLGDHPDLVLIMAGTNDIARGAGAEQILERVTSLHNACHQHGVRTIALAPPTVSRQPERGVRDHFKHLLHAWARGNPNVVAFLDVEEVVPRNNSGFWESDGIHLAPAGSRELGMKLAPVVAVQLPGASNNFTIKSGLKQVMGSQAEPWLPHLAPVPPISPPSMPSLARWASGLACQTITLNATPHTR